jgi:hypothetical protein
MQSNYEDFDCIIGNEFDFFGVCMNEFKLDDIAWEALEDDDDDYRSYLNSIVRTDSDGIFFDRPLARVRLLNVDDGDHDLYKLVDVRDGHVWLSFGTRYYDDCYPYFLFEYLPKQAESDD